MGFFVGDVNVVFFLGVVFVIGKCGSILVLLTLMHSVKLNHLSSNDETFFLVFKYLRKSILIGTILMAWILRSA